MMEIHEYNFKTGEYEIVDRGSLGYPEPFSDFVSHELCNDWNSKQKTAYYWPVRRFYPESEMARETPKAGRKQDE